MKDELTVRIAEAILENLIVKSIGFISEVTIDQEAKTVKIACYKHPETEWVLLKNVTMGDSAKDLTTSMTAAFESGNYETCGLGPDVGVPDDILFPPGIFGGPNGGHA